MSRWNLSWLLGITAITLVGLSIAYSAPGRDSSLHKKHENLRLLVDVLEEVQQKYVKELDGDKMRDLVENMVNSGLERLDPHSSFINADEYKQFQKQSRGRFGGIGIRIGIDRSGAIFVESPMVGTPAYEAGVLAGDLIVKVEDQTTENMSLKKVVELIQGEPGTKVKLSVLHEGEKKPVDLEITRAEIAIDSILGDHRSAENPREWDFWVDPATKIAYIRVVAFTETTVPELVKVVQHLQKSNMRGLIIDLRNNPGGLLRSAVEVSSLFLPEGQRVVSTKGRNQREEAYDSKSDGHVQPAGYPIAILINRYSASASEIVAAALQDHLRAIIIGERSYGKGSVQNIIGLESGTSALKLTTASYWRPNSKNIHRFPDSKEDDDWGVKPNDSGYKLTAKALAALQAAGVPGEVTAKLEPLSKTRYTTEKAYLAAVGEVLPAADVTKYKAKLLDHADHGYEVRLTDEERIEYFKWRRDRDVVRRQGQEPKKEDAPAKEFKDRVLEKALEYIRNELNQKNPPQQGAVIPPAPAPREAILEEARLFDRSQRQLAA